MAVLQQSNMLAIVFGALLFCLIQTQILAAALDTRSLDANGSPLRSGSNSNVEKTLNPLQSKHDFNFNRRYERSIYGLGPRMLEISHSKIPIELDLLVENDDDERNKRFDDYGHMRFGKRGGKDQFDDYGHMRFGRSV